MAFFPKEEHSARGIHKEERETAFRDFGGKSEVIIVGDTQECEGSKSEWPKARDQTVVVKQRLESAT